MSEKSNQSTKAKDGKTKYATLSLFNTYKGKTLETQKTTGMHTDNELLLRNSLITKMLVGSETLSNQWHHAVSY